MPYGLPAKARRSVVVAFLALMSLAVVGASCASGEGASDESDGSEASTSTALGGLFDDSSIHRVAVEFDSADYEAMIDTYAESQDKEWIAAEVTVDGSRFEHAGMRLKGNSSLFSLRSSEAPGAVGRPALPFGPGGEASADDPESLPWLVSLDRFEEDKPSDDTMEFVIRSSSMKTALNEALALDLLGAVGLASQKASYASFTVNGEEPALRLVVENPNDSWDADHFEGEGILYKAEASGNWTYRGDDPDAYKEVFDQETRSDEENLAPLIELLEFVNESDDATFAAELSKKLDTKSFAKYLAFEDLIDNFDDIDGPGNNSYVRWDESSGKFTVVAWDHNLAFGAMNRLGRSAGGGPGGPPMPNGDRSTSATGEAPATPPPAGAPGNPFSRAGNNPLVNRFKAIPRYRQLYDDALTSQRKMLYESGTAMELLAYRVSVLEKGAAKLIDTATIDEERAQIETVIKPS